MILFDLFGGLLVKGIKRKFFKYFLKKLCFYQNIVLVNLNIVSSTSSSWPGLLPLYNQFKFTIPA